MAVSETGVASRHAGDDHRGGGLPADFFFTGNRIARWEGGLFLGYYAAYIAFLVLDSAGSPGVRTSTQSSPGLPCR